MNDNLAFNDDELASAEFKIFFTKRDFEVLLYRGEVVVTKKMTGDGFIAWRIAEFVSDILPGGLAVPTKWAEASYPPASCLNNVGEVVRLPGDDYQYLRRTFKKTSVSPRDSGNYEERRTKAIEGILERI